MSPGFPGTSPNGCYSARGKPLNPLGRREGETQRGHHHHRHSSSTTMASRGCTKDDLLEDNRTDSGIDSSLDPLKSEEPREPSTDLSGPRDKFSAVEERLDSAYGSSSLTVESLSEIVEVCTISSSSAPVQSSELSEQEEQENLLTTITEDGDT